VVIAWALLKSPFTSYGRARSWKRVVIDRISLLVMTGMNRRQIRAFFGPTRKAYDDFIKSKKWEPVVEELGEDARLLWIGPKQTDRVLLYFHGMCINYGYPSRDGALKALDRIGGALVFGTAASSPAFWNYMQKNLERKGKPTGAAILNYCEAILYIPSPFHQANSLIHSPRPRSNVPDPT
jgi:hypothetical protein